MMNQFLESCSGRDEPVTIPGACQSDVPTIGIRATAFIAVRHNILRPGPQCGNGGAVRCAPYILVETSQRHRSRRYCCPRTSCLYARHLGMTSQAGPRPCPGHLLRTSRYVQARWQSLKEWKALPELKRRFVYEQRAHAQNFRAFV